MSSRRSPDRSSAEAAKLRAELANLKMRAAQVEAAGQAAEDATATPAATNPPAASTDKGVPKLSELSRTEMAAASLGVNPDAWRPIPWINREHYKELLRKNAIDGTLVRRIEAFRAVAQQSS